MQKEAVNKEVHIRALFSLEQSKGEILKYPTFAGDAGQDFVKFKERTEYRFKRSPVAEQNQLENFRETLKAWALRLIPEITGDIDATRKILKDAFGDAKRVLQQGLDLLGNMGDLPAGNEEGTPNFLKQVEFLLKLENILKDIIELRQGDDVDMMYLAYNSRTIGTIINKFPDGQILKLNKQGVTGRKRLENVLIKITEFRGEAQALEKTKSMLTLAASNKPRERYEANQ